MRLKVSQTEPALILPQPKVDGKVPAAYEVAGAATGTLAQLSIQGPSLFLAFGSFNSVLIVVPKSFPSL